MKGLQPLFEVSSPVYGDSNLSTLSTLRRGPFIEADLNVRQSESDEIEEGFYALLWRSNRLTFRHRMFTLTRAVIVNETFHVEGSSVI